MAGVNLQGGLGQPSRPQQQSGFQQSSQALTQALGNIQAGANANPWTQQAAGQSGLGATNQFVNNAASLYGQSASASIVPRTMNQYLNPYQDQVIGNTLGRMREDENIALNDVRGQAAQSGAYGGARQGLVEAELRDRGMRNRGEAASAMSQQGFNTAAQFGQSRIGQLQNAGQGFAGLGGQEYNRAGTLGQLGLAQSSNQLQAAQVGLQGANTAFDLTGRANDMQARAGGQQNDLMSQILGQSNMQYDQYANYPQQALGTALAGVSGNPLAGATTSTNRYNPGLLDYAAAASGFLGGGK